MYELPEAFAFALPVLSRYDRFEGAWNLQSVATDQHLESWNTGKTVDKEESESTPVHN